MWEQLSVAAEKARGTAIDLAASARRGCVRAERRLRRSAVRVGPWLSRLGQVARVRERWGRLRPRLATAGNVGLAAAAACWRLVRAPLLMVLQLAAALVVLFEEWGWRPLVALLGTLARFEVWARLELFIAGLPPYGALAALALPTSILLPLKLLALYLLAQGHALSGGALFIAAKLTSTALIARLLMLTKPALMRIGWFARAHDWLIPWQEAMFAVIRASWVWRYGRMVKTRVRLEAKKAWLRLRPRLVAALARAPAAWARLEPRLKVEALRVRLAVRRMWQRVRRA
jgi:hypothetical protein